MAEHVSPADDPAGFQHPFHPAVWPDPTAAYRWLRGNAPLFDDPLTGLTLLSRHGDCSALMRDRTASVAAAQQQRARGTPLPTTMLNTDPPQHDALRAPAMAMLGPQVAAGLTPALQREIADLLAASNIGRDVIDGVAGIAIPFATAVLALLLGLPRAGRSRFTELARGASINLDPLAGAEQISAGEAATRALAELLVAQAAQAAANTPLGEFWSAGNLGEPERAATLMLVVVGGFEPLVSLAATGLHELASDSELRMNVGANEQASQAFVDELLRLQSPIPFVARHATADISLESGILREGANALLLLGAANRDPELFERPDDLMLTRESGTHLAFGAGTHYCPGAPLVRTASQLLFTAIARQLPELTTLAAKPRWRRSIVPRSLSFLPLQLARPAS